MDNDRQTTAQLQSEIAALRHRIVELEVQAAQSEQATAALQQSEARFTALFRASPVAVVISSLAEGRYLDVNDHFCLITRYTRGEVIGRTSTELGIWVNTEARLRIGQKLIQEQVVRDIELTFYTKLQEPRIVIASLALIYLESQPCVLTMCHDITERQQTAVERERLLAETEKALHIRDDFLSIAAHELKTPLTAIQLHVDAMQRMLRKTEPAPAIVERILSQLDKTARQTRRLTKLISDLLDVTRIRADQLHIHWEAVDLAQIVRTVVAGFMEQLVSAGCTLELSADIPSLVDGDQSRLEQVVTNLLSNALKYGPGQPIAISVIPDETVVRLIVRDHGIGIAQDHHERVFQRFERAVSSNHYGGLGLGLYIVQHIVTALHGSIAVESEPGAGATFIVMLPRSTHGTFN